MRRVKVAFIGSHGVGKTTLCFELASVLKEHRVNVDIVKEVARQCPLPINRNTSLEAQTWILTTQIAEEIRATSQNAFVVCDRSVLDNYAYMICACGRQLALEPMIESWFGTYDLLFKVPVSSASVVPDDGVRDTELDFRQRIDRLVDALIEEKRVPCERLDFERGAWIDQVRTVLQRRKVITAEGSSPGAGR